MGKDTCRQCVRRMTARQDALQCDICSHWYVRDEPQPWRLSRDQQADSERHPVRVDVQGLFGAGCHTGNEINPHRCYAKSAPRPQSVLLCRLLISAILTSDIGTSRPTYSNNSKRSKQFFTVAYLLTWV